MNLNLIWAESRNRVIGKGGRMPWYLPEDLAHFRAITWGRTCVMGRRTWESLPDKVRPLPGRACIVMSRNPAYRADGADAVLIDVSQLATVPGELWVIGGAELFTACLPLARRAVITEVDADYDGDTFAPDLPDGWDLDKVGEEKTSASGIVYRISEFAPR